jgi:hypothetical protein
MIILGENRPMEATTHRIQLALTGPAYETLGSFKRLMGASSVTEVIRSALATIQWLRDRVTEGYDIVIEKDGQRISITRLLPIPLVADVGGSDNETAVQKTARSLT